MYFLNILDPQLVEFIDVEPVDVRTDHIAELKQDRWK